MKKYFKLLFIFLLPILILDFVLVIKYGIKGFSNLFIIEDMHSQYASLIKWMQGVLQGSNNLFYSFSKGIGGNMFSTFAYYLSSPLNLLLLFFDKSHYIDAIALLIHIKIGLCAVTMYIFLKYKFKNISFPNVTIFSVIYALSGAIVNFYSNIMWLDIAYLIPLVIMGLDKIIHKEKSYQYVICLSIAMISNFYMAYMLCIFCVIYYAYEMIITYNKKDKEVIIVLTKKFICHSILAALISSIIIIPMVMDMTNMFRYGINKPILYSDLEAIPMIFSKLFIGSMNVDVMFSHNEANIYISIFSLLLVIFFFFNKKVQKKERVATGLVILIFISSMLFNGLNLIWHGFSFPNGYNYRFVFFMSFFLITISCKQFLLKNDKIKLGCLYKYIIFLLSFILISIFLNHKYEYLSNIKIIITLLFIIIYFFGIMFRYKMQHIAILILVLIELGINISYSFITKKNVNEWYLEKYNSSTIENIQQYSNSLCSFMINDNLNYRIDTRQLVSYNDGFVCNYSGINTALSTNHAKYYEFLNNAGFSVTYSTIIDDFENGPFIDSILGLQNIYKTNTSYQPYYIYQDAHEMINIEEYNQNYIEYKNPYALHLGYEIQENSEITFNKNPFEYQNNLAKQMSGLNLNIFEKVDSKIVDVPNKNTQSLSFYAEDKNYYIYNYVPVPINTTYYGELIIHGVDIKSYVAGSNGIIALEDHVVGQEITVLYTPAEEYKDYVDLQIYSFNQENFEMIINKLKEHQLEVTKREKNFLQGNITVSKDDSLLMITVPYEKGWNIYVDREKVDYEEVYDTFVGIRLNEGSHEIKMIFYSPGIAIGSVMSIVGIGIFYMLIYKDKKTTK